MGTKDPAKERCVCRFSKEGISQGGPILNALIEGRQAWSRHALQDGYDDCRQRPSGNISGSHQHTGTLVRFGDQFIFGEFLVFSFLRR